LSVVAKKDAGRERQGRLLHKYYAEVLLALMKALISTKPEVPWVKDCTSDWSLTA
jgi:hypothetical protein